MGLIKGKQIATGANGIATANIVDINVTTGKLAANAVTAAKAKLDETWAFTVNPTMNADPSADNDLARKAYVDAVATGLDIKSSVDVATAAALPACTAAGSKVGKTLTGNAVGVLTVDGVATVLNDRILVKDQAEEIDNGIYKVTTAGTAGVAFILTRATDADQDAEVTAGMYTFVAEGTVNADAGFVLTSDDPITVDTNDQIFAQFSGTGSITAGTGLTKTGSTINAIGGNGITANADDLEVDYGLVGAITTVDAGDSASAGVAHTAARGDHQHGVSTAAPDAAAQLAAAAAEGDATTLSRSDHVHQANTVGDTIEPDDSAAIGTSQDIARADHTHGIVCAAPDAAAQLAAAVAEGDATSFSRSNHVHQANTVADIIQPDDAAAVGTSQDIARADHTHGIVAAAAVAVGTSNAEGSSTSFSRADHVHDSPAPTTGDKALTCSVTSSDFDAATASTVTTTPALDSYVAVMVNGIRYEVGDAVKTKDCYFSGDAGANARAIAAIVATDTCHWVGSVAGFELAATDEMDWDYIV